MPRPRRLTIKLNVPRRYRLIAALAVAVIAALVGLYGPAAEGQQGRQGGHDSGGRAGRIAATVVEVYDGDTLVVALTPLPSPGGRGEGHKIPLNPPLTKGEAEGRGIYRVRLIGIDCPETRENEKHFRDARRDKRHGPAELLKLGRKAREFTMKAVPPGSIVQLELDAQERDRYGRLLAYVWVSPHPTPTRPFGPPSPAGGEGKMKGASQVMLNALLVKEGMAGLMTIPPNVAHAALFKELQAGARAAGRGIWARR